MPEKEQEQELEEVTAEQEEALEEEQLDEQLEESQEEEKVEEVEEVEEVDEVTALEQQLAEEQNKYLRLLADFDNYRRRQTQEAENMRKYRAQSVISDLLAVIDNFDRALATTVESPDAISLKEGVEMVQRTLMEALVKEGLEVIEATDQPFDPNIHQAVMTGADSEKESGIVLQELQKGYMLNGRVIRPAMVQVNE
ncbi:nucleotide exchange factor GrpE [Savagea faecisuis]|uniref:Protein GrpE n=1 Tax=Savagea faecisuis TaxID=1274803 RepID=A0ABW3GXI4_9BACL